MTEKLTLEERLARAARSQAASPEAAKSEAPRAIFSMDVAMSILSVR